MTTQKYKSLLVIIWALWAFHPCLAIDDVLRTAKRDAILAQITGAVRPKKQISLISFGAKGDGKKDCKPAFDKAMKRAAHMGGAHIVVPAGVVFHQILHLQLKRDWCRQHLLVLDR